VTVVPLAIFAAIFVSLSIQIFGSSFFTEFMSIFIVFVLWNRFVDTPYLKEWRQSALD